MEQGVRVIIADDHQLFIDGVTSLLRKEKHIVFVHESPNGEDAFQYISANEVDLLITDISMPGMSGTELTRKVKEHYPNVKILVLSMFNDSAIVSEIIQAEAEGYILKNTGKQELLDAITRIMGDGTYYSPEVIAQLLNQTRKTAAGITSGKPDGVEQREELTPRELEILQLVCEELTTADIAEKLFISPRTVDTHRKNILEKTKSKTIVGLIKYAYEQQLIN